MPPKCCILLLRNPDEAPADYNDDGTKPLDKYERAIRERLTSYTVEVHSLGVLKTQATNVEELSVIDPRSVSGVVFTSARACETWKAAMAIRGDEKSGDWSASGALFYAVGKGTADALKDHAIAEFRGTQSGTAENLGDFIVDDPELQDLESPVLLYLTGDKNRETLPKKLTAGGIMLRELQAYATSYDDHFGSTLEGILGGIRDSSILIIAFFAPSSAKMALPVLREKGVRIPSQIDVEPREPPYVHILAIGPTTADHLTQVENVEVAATASSPTPDGLAELVESVLST